ncbi:unnamed protein product [Arabis nemorensis]|uniref:Uncharacterized protein n=1 Tax=Arabis nemorensis TaxID=586526 RepID=A0A565CPJ5_9BRAS|nr:unnamed protein product [Arabis nemorensis]
MKARRSGDLLWKLKAKTKSLSETNTKNRLSQGDGKGYATQNDGPKTIEARERAMTIANNSVPPHYEVVLRDTHTNKKTKLVQDKVVDEILAVIEEARQIQLTHLSQAGSNAENLPRAK